jgi:hypothetical protein
VIEEAPDEEDPGTEVPLQGQAPPPRREQ